MGWSIFLNFRESIFLGSPSACVLRLIDMPRSGWRKYRRILRLLRLLPAVVSIIAVVSLNWMGDWSIQFFTINGFIIFWDSLSLAFGRRQSAILSLELIIFAETMLLAASVYGIVEYAEAQQPPQEILIILLWVLATIITLILFYQCIRDYLEHWRLRRYSRGIKPLIAFSDTGDPIAVLPITFRHNHIAVERLSIDSLQQPHEGE
ncbi:hypothetical protein F4860DRAFT_491805 [Xylaria cubensis]|nr:hypothetical protein F4860DRAFT_491805 [Xylaria cubensis]